MGGREGGGEGRMILPWCSRSWAETTCRACADDRTAPIYERKQTPVPDSFQYQHQTRVSARDRQGHAHLTEFTAEGITS